MQNHASVLALGHAIVDVLARTDDDQVAALGLEKGTMTLVGGERAKGLYSAISPVAHASGGSAANTAACLASLGGQVRFVGKVADDQLGAVFTEDIRSAGVEYDTPPGPADGPHTGRCLVLVTPDAEKTMCTDLGAGATVDPADLHVEAIRSARVLYMEGYLCGPPDTTKTVHEAASVARGSGTLVAFSASDPGWVAVQRPALLDFLESVDVLFANEPEALGLSGRSDLDGAVGALLESCPLLAVTLGADGCLIATPEERIRVPAVEVAQVVDSTGAGDSFAAGFLYGLVNGRDHTTSARLGALAAGEIVSHLGARPLARLSDLAGQAGLI
jgi:sugar/nucleoside kinase (ribokinase family)